MGNAQTQEARSSMKATQYGHACNGSEARSMQALQKALLPRRAGQANTGKARTKNVARGGAENYAPLGIFSPSLARSPLANANASARHADPMSIFSPTAGVPRTPLHGLHGGVAAARGGSDGDDSTQTPSPAGPVGQRGAAAGNGYTSVPMGTPGMEMGSLTPNTRTALRC